MYSDASDSFATCRESPNVNSTLIVGICITILMTVATSRGSYLISTDSRTCTLWRVGVEVRGTEIYSLLSREWPAFLCKRRDIRMFVQIKVQVGHSGQCQYFISATSVRPPRPFFSFGLFNDKHGGRYARGNYKDATLFLHAAAVVTNIFPTNTSAPFWLNSKIDETPKKVNFELHRDKKLSNDQIRKYHEKKFSDFNSSIKKKKLIRALRAVYKREKIILTVKVGYTINSIFFFNAYLISVLRESRFHDKNSI